MKIKLDENLPATLASTLNALGHDVHTVGDEELLGHSDPEIWQAAQREERFLITQDKKDFSDLRQFAPGKHYGILQIRLHSPGRQSLKNLITKLFTTQNVEDWRGCLVVATEWKLRVRKP